MLSLLSCEESEKHVDIAVESISVDPASVQLYTGDSIKLEVTILPEEATDKVVSWISSDPETVSVDGSGQIHALKSGTAIITAAAGGKSAGCEVSCSAKMPAGTEGMQTETI